MLSEKETVPHDNIPRPSPDPQRGRRRPTARLPHCSPPRICPTARSPGSTHVSREAAKRGRRQAHELAGPQPRGETSTRAGQSAGRRPPREQAGRRIEGPAHHASRPGRRAEGAASRATRRGRQVAFQLRRTERIAEHRRRLRRGAWVADHLRHLCGLDGHPRRLRRIVGVVSPSRGQILPRASQCRSRFPPPPLPLPSPLSSVLVFYCSVLQLF
jgi:hypothetical protein